MNIAALIKSLGPKGKDLLSALKASGSEAGVLMKGAGEIPGRLRQTAQYAKGTAATGTSAGERLGRLGQGLGADGSALAQLLGKNKKGAALLGGGAAAGAGGLGSLAYLLGDDDED